MCIPLPGRSPARSPCSGCVPGSRRRAHPPSACAAGNWLGAWQLSLNWIRAASRESQGCFCANSVISLCPCRASSHGNAFRMLTDKSGSCIASSTATPRCIQRRTLASPRQLRLVMQVDDCVQGPEARCAHAELRLLAH